MHRLLVRLVLLYGAAVGVFTIAIQPYWGGSLFWNGRSVLAYLLGGWYPIACVAVLAASVGRGIRYPIWSVLGLGVIAVLALRAAMGLLGDEAEYRDLGHSLGFFVLALALHHWSPSRRTLRVATCGAGVLLAAAGIWAVALAFGVFAEPLQISTFRFGEERFTLFADIGILLVLVFFVQQVITWDSLGGRLVSLVIIAAALIRIVTSATRGILAGAFLAVAILGWRHRREIPAAHSRTLAVGAASLLIALAPWWTTLAATQAARIGTGYVSVLMQRDALTLDLRIAESRADLRTFAVHPLLGAGTSGASLTDDGDVSYGHFFLTGMLARVGLVGTGGLLAAYLLYFTSEMRRAKRRFDKAAQIRQLSLLVILPFLFVFGNPIYLMICWSAVPFFFSSYEKDTKFAPAVNVNGSRGRSGRHRALERGVGIS
jgi:hypothetical protein